MITGGEPGTVLVGAALEMFARTAKSPLEKLVVKLAGKKLVIVGPSGSGKTSLADYLRYGITAEEDVRHPSEDVETLSAFSLELAHGRRLSAKFKFMKTLPGQLFPGVQAKTIKDRKPTLAIVMLDLTQLGVIEDGSEAGTCLNWFEEFADAIVLNYSQSSLRTRSKVKILVVLNKRDKVNAETVPQARKKIEKIINGTLARNFSNHSKRFRIMPCCLIDSVTFGVDRDKVVRQILAELQ